MTSQINFHPFGMADGNSVQPVGYSFNANVENSDFDMGIILPYFKSNFNMEFSFSVAPDCGAGYYSIGNICYPCSPGTYSFPGSFECQLCTPGFYSGYFANSCIECPPGETSDWGAAECFPCPTGWTNCTSGCPAGYYMVTSSGSEFCYKCPPGTFSASNSTECSLCDSGYFAPNAGSSSCTACPIGYYSYYLASSACTPCPTGSFSLATATVNCSYCAAGSYSSVAGSDSCTSCSPGSYSSVEGASNCTSCNAGYYSSSNSSSCSECQVGSIVSLFFLLGKNNVIFSTSRQDIIPSSERAAVLSVQLVPTPLRRDQVHALDALLVPSLQRETLPAQRAPRVPIL